MTYNEPFLLLTKEASKLDRTLQTVSFAKRQIKLNKRFNDLERMKWHVRGSNKESQKPYIINTRL